MDQKVKLELTIQQLNIVLTGVSKLPIEIGLSTFDEIRKQVDSQTNSSRAPEGPLSNRVIN